MATAAAYASNKSVKNEPGYNKASNIQLSTMGTKVGSITSPYLTQPIKIEIPSLGTQTSFPLGAPIRFPKVNTANNRVPSNSSSNSSSSGTLKNKSCM